MTALDGMMPAAPPMLPSVREALLPLLEHVELSLRADVREFAREAGALGYAAGYADGFEDGVDDHGADEGGEVLRLPGQRQPCETRLRLLETDGPVEEPQARCFAGFGAATGNHSCDLLAGHAGVLHQHADVPRGRMLMWSDRGPLLVLADAEALDALLRSVLYDPQPDMERLRRLASALRQSNLKDCLS